jgi:hypothetical protein
MYRGISELGSVERVTFIIKSWSTELNCYYIKAKATVYILIDSTQGWYLWILFEVFNEGFYEGIMDGI